MANLVSLKGLGDSGEGTVAVEKPSRPSYPWGMKLTLDRETLDKLGLDPANFNVGDVINIEGKAEVVSLEISENEYSDGIRKSIGLQITDISINNSADFDEGFKEALAEDSRIYRGLVPEAETQGGFKKALWNATR